MAKHPKTRPVRPAPAAPARSASPAPTALFRADSPALWFLLPLLALLVYLPTLWAGFTWDETGLTQNPLLGSLGGLWQIWVHPSLIPNERHYWPLTYTTFWFEHALWGLRPWGFHLVNVLLHGACGVLLWRVLRRLALPGAALAAVLFVVHPVHAESVAWIIERKDVLSGALYLGAALAWLRFDETRRPAPCALAFLLFAAALLAKSVALGLPLALALALWWRRGRLTWRDAVPLAGLALLAAALTALDLAIYRAGQSTESVVAGGLLERLQLAGRAFWCYPLKLAWPWPLATFYPKWTVDAGALAGWLPLAAIPALLAALWAARRRLGRGPLAVAAFYLLTLAPTLGAIPYGFMRFSWVADRFQYLASLGPLAALAAVLARRLPRPAPAALAALLGLLTWVQAGYYRDAATLFRHSVAAYPAQWAARYHLGATLSLLGRSEEAAAELAEAHRLNPSGYYKINHDLAQMLARVGQVPESIALFEETLKLAPDVPEVHNNYGGVLARAGQADAALAHYREALRLHPQYPEALNNLGNLLARGGKPAEAEPLLREAVRLRPEAANFHTNLASVLATSHKTDEALAQYQEALRRDPNYAYAHANLGLLLLDLGRTAEAAQHFEAGVRVNLRDPLLRYSLGEAYHRLGRPREAAEQLAETLRLAPAYPGAAALKAQCEQDARKRSQ